MVRQRQGARPSLLSAALTRRQAEYYYSLCSQLLRTAFEVYGEVTDAFVAYNGRSSRGFGYVTFKDDKAATKAVCSSALSAPFIA